MKNETKNFIEKTFLELIEKNLKNDLANQIQEWFFEDSKSYIEDIDSGYDYSSFGQKGVLPFSIHDYKYVSDFLEEPTGETIPTYISEQGMSYQSYSCLLFDYCNDLMNDYKTKSIQLAKIQFPEENLDEDDFIDDDFDDINSKGIDIIGDIEDLLLIDILGDIPPENTHSYWKQATKLIENLSQKEGLYITIMGFNQLGTFASDNWEHLIPFWTQLINTNNPTNLIVLTVRQFTKIKIEKTLVKRVASIILLPEKLVPLSALEMKEASTIDSKTNQKIVAKNNTK